jgi:UDPglucose--hexose-1-phosphate uridylyltransferase
MELRKDPITRSWVLTGDMDPALSPSQPCPYCAGNETLTQQPIYSIPFGNHPGAVRVFPHPRPLYRIEGRAERRAERIYDKMRTVGAHEIIIESPDHHSRLSTAEERDIACLLNCWAARIDDLKKDIRFKYVTVFKNQGKVAGQELTHPHSELTATPFIPRRILYELRASHEYYGRKERCVFCDIERQEEQQGLRVVDISGNYLALCPFASRVPYELWIIPRYHHSSFESDLLHRTDACELAGILRRCLARLEQVTDDYHLVLHTSPNTNVHPEVAGYWATIADDYHWHIEIVPIAKNDIKSYSVKEAYYCPTTPETAAAHLRDLPANREAVPQQRLEFQHE